MMKKFITYQVILNREEDGSTYTVRVPALPDCITYGATPDEAIGNAKEAIELTVESRLEEGLDPSESTIKPFALNQNDLVSYITVELPYEQEKTFTTYQFPAYQKA